MAGGGGPSYELLVQSILDYAIFMVDPGGTVVRWNTGAEQIYDLPARDILGRRYDTLFTEEDRAAGRPQHVLDTARSCGRFHEEALRVRRDGSRFWASTVCDAMHDEHGRLAGFAMVTRDISLRRATEEKLREVERRFRLFVDGVTDCAICMLDRDGIVTDWNAGAERIKGYAAGEIIGRPVAQFFIDATAAETALAVARANGRYQMADWQLRKDGSRFLAELSIDAIHDAEGRLLGFAKITRDITARQATERRLEETREQLFQSQKIEALGQLTGGIAHDFNNLLQGILGSLEVVQMRLARGQLDNVERYLTNATESARRAATLTHRLLAFARRQPLTPMCVNLNELVESMADILARTMGERIALELDLAADLLPTRCDANQLESAILNLAINARDAMPEGGRLVIRTRQVAPGEVPPRWRRSAPARPALCLEVADSGMGMPPEVRARAFDPFFTTKPKGRGTGLGLSMIHGFVAQSQGTIEIDSAPGQGTTVSIYLPCTERRAVRDQDEHGAPVQWAPAAGEVILLAEDEDVVREVVAGKLRELNYQVLEVRDGHAGLSLLASGRPVDLVVSDVGLPGLTGPQMIEAARRERPDLKVLFVTGYAETLPEDWLLDAGLQLLTKPFQFDTLIERIRQLLPPGPGPALRPGGYGLGLGGQR